MENKRKRYSAEFKFKVALEAFKERQTMSELRAKFGVHSTQIGQWKKQLLQEGMEVFKEETKGKKENQVWDSSQTRLLVEPPNKQISIGRQCELPGLSRSAYYYEPYPESKENLELMPLLDKQYMDTPY